jgi:hypothetical protein
MLIGKESILNKIKDEYAFLPSSKQPNIFKNIVVIPEQASKA